VENEMKNWFINITVILYVLILLCAAAVVVMLKEVEHKIKVVSHRVDMEYRETQSKFGEIEQYIDSKEELLANTDKTLLKRIERINGQIKLIDSSIDADKKRRAKIHKIAKAIRDTLPDRHPFRKCRTKPTPGTINTIATAVVDVGHRYGVSESLILAIIRRESAFCQAAVSRAGARGLMQLMPETAEYQMQEIAAETGYGPKPWKIKDNIWLGTYYISKRLIDFNGNEDLALKAYNAGINHVQRVLSGETKRFWKEPEEYAEVVLTFKREYQVMGLD
jgi:hypothetical protein